MFVFYIAYMRYNIYTFTYSISRVKWWWNFTHLGNTDLRILPSASIATCMHETWNLGPWQPSQYQIRNGRKSTINPSKARDIQKGSSSKNRNDLLSKHFSRSHWITSFRLWFENGFNKVRPKMQRLYKSQFQLQTQTRNVSNSGKSLHTDHSVHCTAARTCFVIFSG